MMRSAEYEIVCSSPLPVPVVVVVVVVVGVAVEGAAPAPLPLPPSPAAPLGPPPAAALSRELVLDEAEDDIFASTPPPASCPPWGVWVVGCE